MLSRALQCRAEPRSTLKCERDLESAFRRFVPDRNRRRLLEAALYTNDEETLFDIERPLIITCIEEVVHRSDLIDRELRVPLPPISDETRRPQQAIRSEFEADCPRLIGAIDEAVAGGLKMLPTVKLAALPCMADFCAMGRGGRARPGLGARHVPGPLHR